jgi:hypothetical protein
VNNYPYSGSVNYPYRAVYYVFDLDPSSFSFSIRFKASIFDPSKGKDNIVTLGESYRWFSVRENLGRVEITANNQRVAQVLNDAHISSEVWHNIFISVDERKKRAVLLLDGVNSFEYRFPDDFSFSVHRVLDSDPMEAGFSLVNLSNGSRFEGCVDYLYVYSRAMSVAEMQNALGSQNRDTP